MRHHPDHDEKPSGPAAKRIRVNALVLLLAAVLPFPLAANAGSTPDEVWVRTWNGPGNHDDFPKRLARDSAGRIYVAGTTYQGGVGGQQNDYSLLQYDENGNLAWARRHGGTEIDQLSDLLLLSDGRVAVTGISWWEEVELLTLVYDSAGNLIWERRFLLEGTNLGDPLPSLAQDSQGDLLVSGYSNDDYLLLKYTAGGTLLWSRSYDGPEHGFDRAFDVTTDAQDGIYLTGIVGGNSAYGTIKYDSAGTFQWEQFESGNIGSVFGFAAIQIAPNGEVVVAGNPESTCGVFEARVWKCSAATGEQLWVSSFPPSPCDSVEPQEMAIDAEGNICVAGFGMVNDTDFHFQTLKYDADGSLLWHREYDGDGTSSDIGSALAIDESNNVYVTGLTTFPPQNRDFATVKYNAAGEQLWDVRWAGPFGTNDGATDVIVTEAGDVYVVGNSYSPSQQENSITIRYRQMDPADSPLIPAEPARALHVTQNPCRDRTSIFLSLTETQAAKLSIYDARGRFVRSLFSGLLEEGSHELDWAVDDDRGRSLPSGSYYARLETSTGAFVSSRITVVR